MVRGPIRYGTRYSATRQFYCAAFMTPRVLHFSAYEFFVIYVYMQNFMFVGVLVIEILEFNQNKQRKKAKL